MPATVHPLAPLENYATYGARFMDLAIWEPYARQICQRHQLCPFDPLRAGLAGTYPTFIVAERWVVKFFGQLFGGAESFRAEQQANHFIAASSQIPAPKLLASGSLFEPSEGWHWPYLIFEFVPGISIGQIYDQIDWDDKLALARQLGEITRHLHQIPLEDTPFPGGQGWETYLKFLEGQRLICVPNHQKWSSLPGNLIAQIEDYLLPPEAIVDLSRPPSLIHADITRDHILGEITAGRWQTRALIDFGDAMMGDIFYELAALHLDVFQRDRHLLRAFLDSYGLSALQNNGFSHKALSVALLHQFDVFPGIRNWMDEIPDSLEALAIQLWG